MQQAIQSTNWVSVEAKVFLFHHKAQHHTAFQEFYFCFGGARYIQKGTHFAHGLASLVPLNVNLQKGVARVLRSHPIRDQKTDNTAKDYTNRKKQLML